MTIAQSAAGGCWLLERQPLARRTSGITRFHWSGPWWRALHAFSAIPGLSPCRQQPASRDQKESAREATDLVIERDLSGVNLLYFRALDRAVEADDYAGHAAIYSEIF
jgi:hypothetical protein